MTKAVIYARYSCENQREESIEGQLRECLAFAKSKGFEVIDKYIDRAISAKTDDRPSFQQMIHDGTDHKFDVVIVWKMDRFSRNRLNALQYKSILKKAKVKLISATEAISDGPEGILLESVLDGMAEYYSADLAQKVKRGMTENILEGKSIGGVTPFGYKVINQKYQIDEIEAPIIRRMFKEYAESNQSSKGLAKELTEEGILSRSGKPFRSGTVYCILKNRKYIGEVSIDGHVNPNAIPPIIEKELFEKVAMKMSTYKKQSSSFRSSIGYALTRKVFCGICGNPLIGESSKKKDMTYNYYRCRNYRSDNCKLPAIKSILLEKLVIEYTKKFLSDNLSLKEMEKALIEKMKSESPTLKYLKSKKAETCSKMDNILKVIESGEGFSGLKDRYQQLEEEKEKTELLIAEEIKKQGAEVPPDMNSLSKLISCIDIKDRKNRYTIINQFIDSVFVYPDGKVTIFFSFKGSKQVQLKDISQMTIKNIKKEFYLERLVGDHAFGISFKDPSFRFAGRQTYKIHSIYKNATVKYYKFLNTLFETIGGIEPSSSIKDQMKVKPTLFSKPFLSQL